MQRQAIDIMAERSPAMISRLVQIADAARSAGHGGKAAIYQAACAELGIGLATLHRAMGEVSMRPKRKQRSDAGKLALSRDEAVVISAALMESHRKGNKQLFTVEAALDALRTNGMVRAERVDIGSGEITPLSVSSISRALRSYGLHPDQLLRSTPAKELKSLHPNHFWQIDASLCVLYYLKQGSGKAAGLQVMDYKKFYKNKPKNLDRIASDRVWSYEATDHYSDSIFVHYVMGAESAENLAEALIQAITQRDNDPFYGAPFNLMLDMGAANTSGPTLNFCRRMDIKLHPHAAGNARATGQVENARNIIERQFEAGLKFQNVASLEELNSKARLWARWYNGTKEHSRHGRTRYAMWQTITADQLRIPPAIELMRELLTHTPQSRDVSDQLRVKFNKNEYKVDHIPGVMIGEKLMVTYNPWRQDCAYIVDVDQNGHEILHEAPLVIRDEAGFADDAHILGEGYRSLPETQLDRNRKEVERVAMQAETLEEAAAKRKAKELPFGGQFNPWKAAEDYKPPLWMPKRGTDHPLTTRTAEAPPAILNHFQAARALVEAGLVMDAEKNRQIAAWYPDGVPESDIPQLKQRLTVRAGLRVVGE